MKKLCLFILVSMCSSSCQLLAMKQEPKTENTFLYCLNHYDRSFNTIPLFFDLISACNSNSKTMVEAIVQQHDVEINGKMKHGKTALRAACINADKDIIEMLLKAGANPNVQTDRGTTPLHTACKRKRKSVVKLLLRQDGIKPNVRDKHGDTPLLSVAKRSRSVLNTLLDCDKVKLYKKNKYNRSFLYIAYTSEIFKKMKQLRFFMKLSKEEQQKFLQEQLSGITMHFFDPTEMQQNMFIAFIEFCVKNGASLMQKNDEGKIPLECAYEEYMHLKGHVCNSDPNLRFKRVILNTFLMLTPSLNAYYFPLRLQLAWVCSENVKDKKQYQTFSVGNKEKK